MHEFMQDLREQAKIVRVGKRGAERKAQLLADALELQILTGVRPSNAYEARWKDIDLDARVWTIPGFKVSRPGRIGTRMKTKKSHRIPLSEAAMAVLRRQAGKHPELVFPGRHEGIPICLNAIRDFLGHMGYVDPNTRDEHGNPKPITRHGFRTTLRVWLEEKRCPFHLAEMILAHETKTEVQRAYARSDSLEARREWLERWGDFCTKPPADVIPIRRNSK
jgi:integrase